MIPDRESLRVEFKSDRARLPDRELIEAVVCLANTEGGDIYLGVEKDGVPTGLHSAHVDLQGLAAMVANRTSPSLRVHVESLSVGGLNVARIEVPKATQVTATSDGTIKRRRLQADGTPQCVPFLPHEIPSRLGDLTAFDSSAQVVPGATLDDFDPAERARLRQFVEQNQGDRSLLALEDDELDGALGLTQREGGERLPTLLGLLLIGREASLRRLVPTHELALQVLEGEEIRTNQFSRAPIVRLVEWLEASFSTLNREEEVQVGLFRVAVPLVDKRAFREAVANAVAHRDYARLGAIHIRLESDALVVSNPGGFVEGVTLENLLTTEPRPRNPSLADALKRIGLVERTGRGVDLIFRGLLRYGRPRPDYGRSDPSAVVLRIPTASAELGFLHLVLEEEHGRGGALPIDSLIALATLRNVRRLTKTELAKAIQKDEDAAAQTLEALVERGFVQPHGNTRGRAYTLSPKIYASLGKKAAYTRQAGFDAIQQREMVLNYARQHGVVRRGDVMELCRLSGDQASRLLGRLAKEGRLLPEGDRKARRYHPVG